MEMDAKEIVQELKMAGHAVMHLHLELNNVLLFVGMA